MPISGVRGFRFRRVSSSKGKKRSGGGKDWNSSTNAMKGTAKIGAAKKIRRISPASVTIQSFLYLV